MDRFAVALVLVLGYCFSTNAQPHALQIFNTQNSPLPENHIRTLAIAPDSTIWIGTENGLATLKNGSWDAVDTLDGYQIRAIAFDASGYAWVGTFLNGLWVQNDTGWVNYTSANSTLPDDYVRTISFCPNDDAWLGTVGGAVHIANGVWTVFRRNNTNWFTENVASSYCTPDNDIWLGGINSGLMHQVDTGWVIYRTIATGLPDNTILDIKSTTNGNLWLAMPAAGAATFDGNLGWVYYNSNTSFNPSNSINHIAVGNDSRIYFASFNKGLVVYKGGLEWFNFSSTARPDTSGAYLPTDELISVIQDAGGIIWASTVSHGLLRIEFLDSTSAIAGMEKGTNIKIYPNPVVDYLIVESPSIGLEIKIYNTAHQQIHSGTTNSPQTKIPLGDLPKGIYIIVLQSHGVAVKKLLLFKF